MDTKHLVKSLCSHEGFFAAVSSRSVEGNIPLAQAWREVEDMRVELGLPQKYKSVESFYVCRHIHHRCGNSANDLIRFNADE